MRHSWASLMLESGSEIGVISQSLGHMSLQTTQIYLGQLSKSKMDKASEDMLDHLVRGSRKKQLQEPSEPEPVPVPPAPVSTPPVVVRQPQPSSGSRWKNVLTSLATRLLMFATS